MAVPAGSRADRALAVGGWSVALGSALIGLAGWREYTSRRRRLREACHELRGPLTVVALGVQLATRTGSLTAERSRAIELELGRAALALEDLERVSGGGAERRRETLELVELGSLLADSVEAWRPAAGARDLRLALPTGFTARVAGSRLRLAQATGNLIANAIEHGEGAIDVCAEVTGATVRVEVLDRGAGLPVPLGSLRSGRRRVGAGSARGHGLAIASGVAAAHGGRLFGAHSGGGARVVLELPLAHPGRANSRSAAGARSS
jgi:signal transduction histidine kinase